MQQSQSAEPDVRLQKQTHSPHLSPTAARTAGSSHHSPKASQLISSSKGFRSPTARRTLAGHAAAGSPQSPAAGSPRFKALPVAEYLSASAEALQAEVHHAQTALNACQAAYQKALADVNRSTAKIQQLQQQVKSLHEEDAVVAAKVPLPVNRLCRVRQWLSEKETALDAEQAAMESKQMALLKAESKLRSQETEASLLDATASGLSTAAAADAADAGHKHDREVTAARRQLALMATQQQHEQLRAADEQQEAERRSRTAARCQGLARERLSASQAGVAAGAAALAGAAAGQHARQLQSLMQLKTKVDEVRESVSKNAEKSRQLQKQKKEQEQREFEALQEQGLNPYKVYRVRDAEAAAARAAAQQAAKQQQRKAEIAAALEAEDRAHRQQVAKQEFDRQVEENYQRQMGITAQQQRTDAYMRTHTLAQQAILNPTSRMPVYPSEAVLVKPVGFGLGRSSPEAVRKVAARHGGGRAVLDDLQDCLLLPSKYRSGHSSPAGASRVQQLEGQDAALPGGMPDPADALSCSDASDAACSGDEADSEEARDVDGLATSSSSNSRATGTDAADGRHGHSRQHRGRQKPLQVATLSKYEAGRLEQAKQQHKAHIAQPKAAFGKVFAGDAFIAQPPAVELRDFVPGQTYRATVQLINRSFTGSSIRLLEVPTEVMHVLELAMPPSGCLAPGASATLRVTFKPQADEPLSASIPLLADSGPLALPFRALVRQALPSIDPSPSVSVDGRAGSVMLGASGHTTATISNAGVLDMLYSVKVTGPLAGTTEYDDPPGRAPPADASEADLAALQEQTWAAASLSVAGIRVQGVKGRVGGYRSLSFRVEFTPRVAGPVEVPVLVSFSAPDSKGLAIPPIALTLTATGKELPVSTLTPVVDFKCVMFGQSYAAPLLLANAGKSAMKVLVVARPELSEWVTFTPDFGFIQASDTLAVSVGLKPTPGMMHKLAKYLVATGTQQDCFEVPVQVSVPGQPLPLPVQLRLQATTSDLVLTPRSLDFGRVPLSEAAGVHITIHNPSALPQGFSFGAKLPLGLSLSPNSGYGRVLPRQSVRLLVTFQPPIPGLQFFELACRALSGRVFRLEGKCDGLQPDVTLSHNVVKFPATSCEDSSSASLIIRNSSSEDSSMFEFGVPQGSHLKVTPRVGLLRPQSSMRVQLDFSPPEWAQLAAAAAAAAAAAGGVPSSSNTSGPTPAATAGVAAAGAAAAVAETEQLQQQSAPSQQQQLLGAADSGHFREWLLPCCIKTLPAHAGSGSGSSNSSTGQPPSTLQPAASTSTDSASGAGSSGSGAADYVLHVSVATCAVSPELLLVSPEMPRPPGKNYWVLDCGALPVGERCTWELVLQNRGADVAALLATPLDPLLGAFSIVTALRPLEAAGGQGRVLLAFSPPDCRQYQEILTLRSAKGRLRVCLRGQGIAPTLAVAPATATSAAGGLVFGDVLLSDPVCKELKVQVTNTCPFTVSFTTRFIGPAPLQQQLQQVQGDSKGAAGVPSIAAAAAGMKPAGAAVAGASAGAAAGGTAAPPAVKPLSLNSPVQQGPAGTSTSVPAAAAAAAATAPPPAATADSPTTPSGCFVCRPSGGVLQAGQTQELTIIFAPLGGSGSAAAAAAGGGGGCGGCGGLQGSRGPFGPLSPYVADRLQVLVPHQQQDVVVPLQGHAWPDGLFVAGPAYKSSSSSSGGSSSSAGCAAGACAAAGSGSSVQDPFAAIMVAAAAAAAAAAPAAAAAGSGSAQAAAKGKQGATAAAAAAAAASSGQQQDRAASQQPLRDVPSALAAAGYCGLAQGYVTLPGPVGPGQVSTATVDFGAIKSSAGGAAGELVVEELAPEAREAGWSVDPAKLSVPAGEKRPLTIRFTAPAAAKLAGTALGALGQLQLPVQQSVRLSLVMKGGCQAMAGAPGMVAVGADGSRRMGLVCSCVLAPAQGEAPAGVGGNGGAQDAATPAAGVAAKR